MKQKEEVVKDMHSLKLNRFPAVLLIIGAFLIIVSLMTMISGGSAFNGSGIRPALFAGMGNFREHSSDRMTYTRPLRIEERMQCMESIEHVYWKHRIWQKDNPAPKPPFSSVVNPDYMRRKVEGSLKKSNALESFWKKPVTAEHLQAEINRMARDTKDPALLAELWSTLNNDSYLVAECLARPLVVERLIRNYHATDTAGANEESYYQRQISNRTSESAFLDWWVQHQHQFKPVITEPGDEYRLPRITEFLCGFDMWTPVANYMPRANHTAVWSGAEMIVWGGWDGLNYLNTGGRYYPATDAWMPTSPVGAPAGRSWHSAVWTGSQMIIWGGRNAGGSLNTGALYDPIIDNWLPVSGINAPSARSHHTAVWSGTVIIIWGGEYNDGTPANTYYLNTGSRYNPGTNSWTATSMTEAPVGRERHTAVWSGTEMIIWGGYNHEYLNTGARYNPVQNSWTATSMLSTPLMRADHTALWTGKEMIIWGGFNGSSLNTGGRYNPVTDSWLATSLTGAPQARSNHTAVWTGLEMIIWGGQSSGLWLNSGARYRTATDNWVPTLLINAPSGRYLHTAVWSGTEMIVWGGFDGTYSGNGGRYCACGDIPAPANLTAFPSGPNHIIVNWSTVPGALSYNLYRRYLACGNLHEELICSEATVPICEDNDVSGNTLYQYSVSALAECESPWSFWTESTAPGDCNLEPCFEGIANVLNQATSACEFKVEWLQESTAPPCTTSPEVRFTVYRSTAPDFEPEPGLQIATCVHDTYYNDTTVQYPLTYYYIVRAEDSETTGSGPCNGGNMDTNLIRKSGSPTGPGMILFSDDFESGLGKWATSSNWQLSNVLSHSGNYSAHSGNLDNLLCDSLTQFDFYPMPSTAATILEFWTEHQIETGMDAGIIQSSVDGTTWTKLALTPNYPATTLPPAQPCLGPNPQPAFSGSATSWTKYTSDLSAFAGLPLKIRFNYATNSSNAWGGWFIDDMKIIAAGSCSSVSEAPGKVLNTLSVAKAGSNLILNWTKPLQPCITENYGIYRGLLPWTGYNHVQLTCTTAGTTYSTPANIDSYYFLVVAQNQGTEGSYGLSSSGSQIPPASAACLPQIIGTCN